MNKEKIVNQIESLKGKKVLAKVYIGRNKYEYQEGFIINTYDSIFTFKSESELKSFTYSDVLTKNVTFKIV